jgi:hypothetical protein
MTCDSGGTCGGGCDANTMAYHPKCRRLWVVLLVVLGGRAALGQAPASSQQVAAPYIGVIEELHNPNPGESTKPISQVRYAFVLIDGKWVPVARSSQQETPIPKSVTWYAISDGKMVGSLKTSGPVGGGKGLHAYAQFLDAPFGYSSKKSGNPVFYHHEHETIVRPLLATTQEEHTTDPELWTETGLSTAEKRKVMREVRKRIPSLPICPTGLSRSVRYSDSDIEILQSFRDIKGRLIVGFQFNRQAQERSGCGASYGSTELDDVWVLIRPKGPVSDLGTLLYPVGAADLDGDGKSEWVFKLTWRGQGDGYRLFYGSFSGEMDTYWHNGNPND